MIYRLVKYSDINDVVEIHYATRLLNDNGIFASMGKPFIRQYYKCVLGSKYTVVVGAENEEGMIVGHCYAILNCEKFDEYVSKKRISLMLAAFTSVLLKPQLLISLLNRYRSLQKKDAQYIINKGVRGGFWGWNPKYSDPLASVEMHDSMLKIIRNLGYSTLSFEVDKVNKIIYKLHKINGAKEIEVKILPDGRERAFMEYDLNKLRTKNI